MKRRILATAAIALCLLAEACDDGPVGRDPRFNRIVCTSAGRVVYDDFSLRNTSLSDGGIVYTSRTTGERSRVTGECYAYLMRIPEGWKPLLPAPIPTGDVRP